MLRIALGLLVVLMLAGGGYLGYTYLTTKQLPDFSALTSKTTEIASSTSVSTPALEKVTEDAGTQLGTLGERAGEITQHAQKVLGSSIQVNEEEKKPLHESAIEYGRYVYCKQVVNEYETLQAQKDSRNN